MGMIIRIAQQLNTSTCDSMGNSLYPCL